VGDRQNANASSIGVIENDEDDRARAVLYAFFAAFRGLGSPKV
jgi:hypothetical protein